MKKVIVGGLVVLGATILGAILAYLAIIWYIDRHPVVKTATAALYVSEQGLCGHGLEYITSKPYWCKPSVLKVTNNYEYQDASSPQVTANINKLEPKVSDAYLQWGNTPLASQPYDPQTSEDVELTQ
jgi:hypothetical protein